MTYRGTIQNGRLKVENGPDLPDGTQINFELINWPEPAEDEDDLFDIAREAVPIGQSDLSTNLDHYLYGHPKVTDEQP